MITVYGAIYNSGEEPPIVKVLRNRKELLEYARVAGIYCLHLIGELDDKKELVLSFDNDTYASVVFSSWRGALRWLYAQRNDSAWRNKVVENDVGENILLLV